MEADGVEAGAKVWRERERERMAQKLSGEEAGSVERMTWRRRDERDGQIQILRINYGLQF
jgi:hypothetical protein